MTIHSTTEELRDLLAEGVKGYSLPFYARIKTSDGEQWFRATEALKNGGWKGFMLDAGAAGRPSGKAKKATLDGRWAKEKWDEVDAADVPDKVKTALGESAPDIAMLSMWMRMALGEDVAPVGTKHKWADGHTYIKQKDGSWTPEPASGKKMLALPGKPMLALPAGKKTATVPGGVKAVAKPGATAGTSAGAPAGAVKATPDKLPDDPFRYFHKTPEAKLIPVSALRTIRARPEGIANAAKHMANAFNGDGEKRKPVSLKDNGDGTYTVADGNSTTAMARQHNWKNIVATVEPADSKEPGHHDAHEPEGEPKTDAEMAASVKGFEAAVKEGKLKSGVSAEEHVKIAKAFLGKHKANLDKSVEKLKGFMPEGVKVKGRAKDVKSALGKLVRKSKKYKTVEGLQDGTGMRVIAKDTEHLNASIEALKKNYKIIESDDYVTAPLEGEKGLGYRSFHAIIEDDDGLQKEVQLRTPNQDAHAEWCHDVYKPVKPEQEAAMKQHADTISDYARKMGDYFHKVDSKEKAPEPPPCPPPVKQYFSCL